MKKILNRWFPGLSKNSWLLALASLFSDISTEMLYPILPLYLTQYLQSGGSVVGIIEGIAQAVQNMVQGFSGYLSDKLQRRKPIALAGYFLSAVSKPFIGFATAWPGVLAARFSDRLGAGIRTAPRDALIASSVDEKHRGKAFGLESFGDNLGACIGPLITILLFLLLSFDIRSIFYLAVIPGLISFLLVVFVNVDEKGVKAKINIRFANFPPAYWRYLLVIALFGAGNSSNAFLILEVRERGLSLIDTVLVYAGYNLVAALVSYPAGFLSDRLGGKNMVAISFLIAMLTYAGFAITKDPFFMGLLFISYGLFQGVFRTGGKTFAAAFVPQHLRASSIGWYATTVGLSALVAGIVAGQLWDKAGHASVFLYGALCSFAGIIALMLIVPKASAAGPE